MSLILYGDPSVRGFGDLDILVSPEMIASAESVLQSAGYSLTTSCSAREKDINTRWGLQSAYRSEIGAVVVELHWRLAPPDLVYAPHFDDLWKRREEVRVAGRSVAGLGREDLLIYLCVHAAKDHWNRLLLLADLAALIHVSPVVDWVTVIQRSHDLGTRRRVAVAMRMLGRSLEVRLPPEVQRWVCADRAVSALTHVASRRLFSIPAQPPPRPLCHLLWILFLDGEWDRIRYVGYCVARGVARHSPITIPTLSSRA